MELSETLLIALIGVAGAIVGSVATVAASIASDFLRRRETKKQEKPRKDLLMAMLINPAYQWRDLKTLSHVVGLDETDAKAMLLSIGARASEDGQQKWGLLSRNPLP